MSKIFKFCGLITLICFSFFYTEKVMDVVSEQDPLKIKIIEEADKYKINPNEAIVTPDTIIPGSNGRVVNIEKSYKKMRKSNVFNNNMLIYDTLYPEYRLSLNLDKYIVSGNINNKEISIVFLILNNNNFNKIINILNKKNITGNFFIEYNFLNNNINNIRKINNHNIYSYQKEYTYDRLIISNNIIKRIANNEPSYCLVTEKNINNLNVCSYSNMNTILPSINSKLNDIKLNLENGSIILFDTSSINELAYLIDYIISKGYKIVGLNELLNENHKM